MSKLPPVGSYITILTVYSSMSEVYPAGTLMKVVRHSENPRTPDYFEFQLPNETDEHKYWIASTKSLGTRWDFLTMPWWV